MKRNRREFLEDVSSGMLIAGLGAGLASDLGFPRRPPVRMTSN
jgi:hypothetical protein